jgi:hypothetical protein
LLAFSRSGVSRGVLVARGEMHKTEVVPFIGEEETISGRVAASTQERMNKEE